MLNGECQLFEDFHRLGLGVDAVLDNFVVQLAALNKLRDQVNPSCVIIPIYSGHKFNSAPFDSPNVSTTSKSRRM